MDQDGTPAGDGGPGEHIARAVPATLVIDEQGEVSGWSDAAEHLLGYSPAEAIGLPARRLLGREAQDVLSAAAWRGRLTLRHRQGRLVRTTGAVSAWAGRDGEPQRLLVLQDPAVDTPVVRTSIADEAFTQGPLPVALLDARLRIVRASGGLTSECGLPEADLLGRRLSEVLPARLAGELEDRMRQVLATAEPQRLRLHLHPPGRRRERVWSVLLSPLRGPAGEVHGVQLSGMDATEQHWSRERLALLDDVNTRVGSTLEVTRTAQEMADLAVEHFADFVTVDLLDDIFRGIEPAPSSRIALRRAAQQSVLPGVPESLIRPGQVDHYPEDSPPALCLSTGQATLHSAQDQSIDSWRSGDPKRSAVVEAFGIHSVMVVPLRARGVSLGVAVLVRHRRPEPFDHDDVVLAREIAARAALSIDNARRYTREHTIALALQRSLLPHRIAGRQAVQAACRYFPAGSRAGVGGDWFDVIALPGARVALVVGDVVGHGLRASATMGRLRTAVRTLADVDLAPDELLVQLDDLVIHQAAEEESITATVEPDLPVTTDLVATCLYAVYDPVSRRCVVASAGHPAPLLITPDGTAELIDVQPGPPLGLGGLPFEATERVLPEGSLLALYTDGLIEAAGRDIDTGLDLLRRALTRPAASLEAACDRVTRHLLPERRTDDAALLLARTRGLAADDVATRELPIDPEHVSDARAWAAGQLERWRLPQAAFEVELIVSELVTNAIRYAEPPMQLRLIRSDTAVICEVSDASSAAPHLRRARVFDEGGRGLLLVAQLAQRWGSRHTAPGKIIWAEVPLNGQPPAHRVTATA